MGSAQGEWFSKLEGTDSPTLCRDKQAAGSIKIGHKVGTFKQSENVKMLTLNSRLL